MELLITEGRVTGLDLRGVAKTLTGLDWSQVLPHELPALVRACGLDLRVRENLKQFEGVVIALADLARAIHPDHSEAERILPALVKGVTYVSSSFEQEAQ